MSTTTELPCGIHPGLDRSDYASIPGINQSALKKRLGDGTWAEVRHAMTSQSAPTASQQRGTAVHMTTLEVVESMHRIVVAPDATWTRAMKVYKEWAEPLEAEGKICVRVSEYDDLIGAARAVVDHPIAGPLVNVCQIEVPIVWRCPDTGVLCKALLDCVDAERVIADIKTANPKPRDFLGQVLSPSNRLAFQAAWYTWGWSVITGVELPFAWVAVSDKAPYLCAVYDATDVDAEVQKYREMIPGLLSEYAACLERDEWPGIPTDARLPYRDGGAA